jgi:AcrR family transcriptional regulator
MARPPRRKQSERSALSEKLIMRAATKLIGRKGYTKTTLAEIGREAGYTAGLVSHRFGSKEGLLRRLVERIRTRFYHDQIEQALDGRSGLEALCATGDLYLNELLVREERLRVLYVLMGEALGPVPEMRSVFGDLDQGFRQMAVGWIEAGIAAGEIRADVDPRLEAAIFVGTLRGVALQWLTSPGALDLERMRSLITDQLRARLASGAAAVDPQDRAGREARCGTR